MYDLCFIYKSSKTFVCICILLEEKVTCDDGWGKMLVFPISQQLKEVCKEELQQYGDL